MTQEEYTKITEQANIAIHFLEGKDFEFLRKDLYDMLEYIESSILNNSIHDVTEEITVSEKIKKLFFTPKKEQIDELKGQYKFIHKFLNGIQFYVQQKKDLEDHIAKGKVLLEGGNEKDVNYVGQKGVSKKQSSKKTK